MTGPGNNAASQITTTFNYTADGSYAQPAQVGQPLTVADGLGHVNHMRYDAQGRRISVTDARGDETDASYNAAGQVEEVTYPATGQTGAGRARASMTYLYPGGPQTAYALYDENAAQARQVSYGYGAEGELKSVSGSAEPVSNAYDALYRLKTLKDGNNNATVYSYDGVGNLSSAQMPGGESVQFPLHDPAGRVLRRVDGNGAVTDYSYADPEKLLTDIQYPATPSLNVHLGYDSFGRRNLTTDAAGSVAYTYGDADELKDATTSYAGIDPVTLSYEYDTKDQLKREVSARGSGYDRPFDYDAAGNPTSFAGASKSYNPNNQQTGPGFAHDGDGNPTTYKGNSLSFDPENRLTAYGGALTAGYRGDGLRAWKDVAGARAYFVYDGVNPVLEVVGPDADGGAS